MAREQKTVFLGFIQWLDNEGKYRYNYTDTYESLNKELAQGWKVVSATPMPGAGFSTQHSINDRIFHSVLLVLEKDDYKF